MGNARDRNRQVYRATIVVGILLLIAAIHVLRVGSYFSGSLHSLYYSFFSDFILPFGIYFLLCLNEVSFPFLRDWKVKAGIVFAGAAFAETLQAFGVPVLGTTFDPLDYLMYAAGALAAAGVDKQLLERVVPFWRPDA